MLLLLIKTPLNFSLAPPMLAQNIFLCNTHLLSLVGPSAHAGSCPRGSLRIGRFGMVTHPKDFAGSQNVFDTVVGRNLSRKSWMVMAQW